MTLGSRAPGKSALVLADLAIALARSASTSAFGSVEMRSRVWPVGTMGLLTRAEGEQAGRGRRCISARMSAHDEIGCLPQFCLTGSDCHVFVTCNTSLYTGVLAGWHNSWVRHSWKCWLKRPTAPTANLRTGHRSSTAACGDHVGGSMYAVDAAMVAPVAALGITTRPTRTSISISAGLLQEL